MALSVGQAVVSVVALLVTWDGVHSARASCVPVDVNNTKNLVVEYSFSPVGFNTLMPLSAVKEVPTVTAKDFDPGRYLLVMVDPDAPSTLSCPDEKYFLHWMTEFNLQNGRVTHDTNLVGYVPPTPPSGTHRYQFLLYPLGDKKVPNNTIPAQRSSFILQDFVKDADLGDVAATFQFKAKAEQAN